MNKLEELRKNYVPTPVARLKEEKMKWFRDAKFGMFLHWGLYSMLGKGEWVMFHERMDVSEYEHLSQKFEATDFQPREWARAAKNAGMKYMVLTTRHHDGFSLFDSKASDFNSIQSAAKKDFVAEYVQACREEGLKVGFYYSPMDWRFPGYFFPEMYFENAMKLKEQCWTQLRELMTNYGKIDLLWFDGEWLAHGGIRFNEQDGWNRNKDYGASEYMKVNYFWESEKLIHMIRELQPEIMINNRGGWEGDFHVRERRIGNIRTDKPWDSNDCLAQSWGWMPDKPMLSLRELIKNFVSIITKDGNYLLNVGPMGNGKMEDRQVKRLAQLGEWVQKYEKAIYSTRGGPFLPGNWGGAVYRDTTVYVHITEWVEDQVVIPSINNHIMNYSNLSGGSVIVKQTGDQIVIDVPERDRDAYDTIIQLDFEKTIEWEGVSGQEEDIYG